MLQQTIYQVDAFTSQLFGGNPAAVCPLDKWLADDLMQAIAAENNLSETAFFAPTEEGFHIRWFTPTSEIDLCGHATLASAHVLFEHLNYTEPSITFIYKLGTLTVTKKDKLLSMDFPSDPPTSCETPDIITRAFEVAPEACLKASDYIVVFSNENTVKEAKPNLALLEQLDLRGVCITAPGDNCDFVCRFFGPKWGIPEDPVTGSAFTQLAPYWSQRLQKISFQAQQISQRGGNVECTDQGNRVTIYGQAVTYLIGNIALDSRA